MDGGELTSKIEELLANLVIPPSSVALVGLFPGAYEKLISAIRLMGYRENVNFFVYAYDWRQSNRDLGAGLAQLMQDLLDDHPEWEATGFDVIAHSMGCLVTAEAHRLGAPIDRKVLIAGPHYGAFLAFAVLNPRVSVIDGFKAFILELAWDARFKYFRRVGELPGRPEADRARLPLGLRASAGRLPVRRPQPGVVEDPGGEAGTRARSGSAPPSTPTPTGAPASAGRSTTSSATPYGSSGRCGRCDAAIPPRRW